MPDHIQILLQIASGQVLGLINHAVNHAIPQVLSNNNSIAANFSVAPAVHSGKTGPVVDEQFLPWC